MSARRFLTWTWFREPGYLVAGWHGRPWSLSFQRSGGWYANLDFSAPVLGDCRLSWMSREWSLTSPSAPPDRPGLGFHRQSWAEIDALEAENEWLTWRVAQRVAADGGIRHDLNGVVADLGIDTSGDERP